jgi:hypothetical protein
LRDGFLVRFQRIPWIGFQKGLSDFFWSFKGTWIWFFFWTLDWFFVRIFGLVFLSDFGLLDGLTQEYGLVFRTFGSGFPKGRGSDFSFGLWTGFSFGLLDLVFQRVVDLVFFRIFGSGFSIGFWIL